MPPFYVLGDFLTAMEIGTLLRKLRDSKRLTTREIADRVGVSLSTYIDWEHDKTAPSLKNYEKLANAFEMGPVELMSYLTRQTTQVSTVDKSGNGSELGDVAYFVRLHSALVMKNNDLLVKELNLIKELIIQRGH